MEENMEQNKRKRWIRLSLSGVFAVAAAMILLTQILKNRTKPIFDKNITTTFYAKTNVGEALDLKADGYFSQKLYDHTKFSFDLSQCDWNTPGLYRVPVLYKEEKTNCVVQIQVGDVGNEDTFHDKEINMDAVITEQDGMERADGS
jgi:hypothetical protein